MKILRIYDHLGELKKEFNIYVEGQDFRWEASVPEVVWLGTITIEELSKELEKPSESVSEPLQPEPEAVPVLEQALSLVQPEVAEPEPGVIVKEAKDAPKKSDRKRSRVKRSTPPASPKSVKELHQGDSGGDASKGD